MSEQDKRTPEEMIADMLKAGGSGRLKRLPRPGLGTFKLCMRNLKRVVEKQTVFVAGKPVVGETVKAYIVEAKVLASTCAENPVGSMLSVFFETPDAAKTDVKKMRTEQLVDFVIAVLRSAGVTEVTKEAYDNVLSDENSVRGFEINLLTQTTKHGKKSTTGTPGTMKVDKEGKPYLEATWSPATNTAEAVTAAIAAFDSEE